MIDIKALRENPNYFRKAAEAKSVDIDIDRILDLDRQVRALGQEVEQIAAQKNAASKQIVASSGDERTKLIEEMRTIDRRGEELKEKFVPLESELAELLHRMPNPPLEDVPVAQGEAGNTVIKTVGEKPHFDFEPRDHQALGELLDIIDTERAGKVSGSRFSYFKGDAVMLEFALMQYALSVVQKHGFTPVIVPHLVQSKAMQAMGYLEHGGHDEIYYLPKDNMYLIGTSEQALGPMHMDETFREEDLPVRYVGFSSCYRREAGSYGKDTRGIFRVHQFDKLELFSFTTPQADQQEHELILSIEEELMQGLGLHYQVVLIGSGDLGLPAAKKYDIETWIPSQNAYRETHSCSTTTDFQARRLNTRYKGEGGAGLVHTLNGTAFAMGRAMVAILENYQEADGSVRIPDVLQPYMQKSVLTPRT